MSGELSTADATKLRNEQVQVLANIDRLQKLEEDLYKLLETQTSVQGNTGNYEDIISRINDLAAARVSLFQTLGSMHEYVQNSVSNARVDLVDQMTMAKVVENELQNSRDHLNELSTIKNNKVRMVEINTYYGKKYRAQTSLMKLIIFVGLLCLLILVLP